MAALSTHFLARADRAKCAVCYRRGFINFFQKLGWLGEPKELKMAQNYSKNLKLP